METSPMVKPTLAIAVLTFRRPAPLADLIPLLIEQARAVSNEAAAYVLVVDNDPDRSAESLVAQFADQGVVYANEPEPGIATARNRAMKAAANTDLLVFIDDDEVPVEDWLANLLATYRQFSSVGVVGNVLRKYEVPPDPWILAGRYFDRDPIDTGTRVHAAGTGNLLLDLNQVRAADVWFDPVFGLSGGSDTLFTRQLVRGGGELIWCADAPVYELIPASRLTRKWVVTRAFRIGNGGARTALAVATSVPERLAVRAKEVGAGIARLGGGGLKYLVGKVTHNMAYEAQGTRTFVRGAGRLTGAFGYHYDREYRKVHKAASGKASR